MAERGLQAEARVLFESARAKGQTGFELYNNFAGLEIAEGNVARAEELLRASLEANPRQLEAYAHLGRLLVETNRQVRGRAAAGTRAARGAPDDAAARQALAAAHGEVGIRLMEAGQPARARAELLKAARVDPTDAAAQLNLALFYAKTGELDLALQAIGKARSLEPSNPSSSLLEADLLPQTEQTRSGTGCPGEAARPRPVARASAGASPADSDDIEVARQPALIRSAAPPPDRPRRRGAPEGGTPPRRSRRAAPAPR